MAHGTSPIRNTVSPSRIKSAITSALILSAGAHARYHIRPDSAGPDSARAALQPLAGNNGPAGAIGRWVLTWLDGQRLKE
jgi:hypothetical protein